jgi:hypothetical protein
LRRSHRLAEQRDHHPYEIKSMAPKLTTTLASFLLAGVLGSMPLNAQVSISREIGSDGERGEGYVKKAISIQIPGGSIDYNGVGQENTAGEVHDLRFGLSFQRPNLTNGGWDLWNFLRVGISAGGEAPFSATSRYLLNDIELLEEEARTMLRFSWSLTQENAKLSVTTVQYPAQPDWVFARIQVEGGEADLATVILSCFPGNTTGPAERERWMDTADGPQPLTDQDMDVTASTSGYVFFNKMAQGDSGCLLVLDAASVETAKINGVYNVSTVLTLKPGQKEMVVALGGFVEQSAEDVARVFKMEGATNTLNFLKRIDWNAKVDTDRHLALIKELDGMLRYSRDQAATNRFKELRDQYQKAAKANEIEGIHTAFRSLGALKDELIHDRLKQMK